MKEMIKRVREERGGFTLAELLIVVAIILVLVAIAIPVFSGALTKADQAVATANIRSIKAEATTKYLLEGQTGTKYYTATVDASGNIGALTVSDTGTVTPVADYKAGDPITVEIKPNS